MIDDSHLEGSLHEPAVLDPAALTEDLALANLKNRNLASADVEEISRSTGILKSRKVRFALAAHPHTPRRIALRLIREFYTFELIQLALAPAVAADLKRSADDLLISRLTSISLGERISLARRSSQSVVGALLLDKEQRVWRPALENSRLTEAAIVRALQKSTVTPGLVASVSHHSKWSFRPEIRIALLRNPHTPLAKAIEFAQPLPPRQLRDILHASRLPECTKTYLRKTLQGNLEEKRTTSPRNRRVDSGLKLATR